MSNYVHHVPGRLRVKVSALRGAAEASACTAEALRSIRGISTCDVNPITGSVLLTYEPHVADLERIAEALEPLGLAKGGIPAPFSPDHRGRGVPIELPEMTRRIGKIAATMAVEKLFERSAFALIGALI